MILKSGSDFTQGHSNWYHSKDWIQFPIRHSIVIMAVSLTVYETFNVKVLRDLENWVMGRSRSLKMAPFDRSYTTFYWSAIVNIALSCTVFDLTLNNIVTLKSGLQVTQGHSKCTIRKLGCGFLFAFNSNYGSILHQFRDKARYWSKIVIFSYPLHSTPPLGGPRRNIAIPFGIEKLEWLGYLMVKKLRICITI